MVLSNCLSRVFIKLLENACFRLEFSTFFGQSNKHVNDIESTCVSILVESILHILYIYNKYLIYHKLLIYY